MLNFKALYREFKNLGGCDAWGDSMSAWFDVAEELHLRDVTVPASWGFKPAPNPKRNADSFFASECCVDASTQALLRFGHLMERYTRMLERHEMSY